MNARLHPVCTTMIRDAVPADAEQIVSLAIKQLILWRAPLKCSRQVMEFHAKDIIARADCFALVHENNAVIDGAILLMSQYGLWFERQVASIVMWVAHTPGSGRIMLRHALRWVDTRPILKGVGLSMDFGDSKVVTTVCKRFGILPRGHVLMRY